MIKIKNNILSFSFTILMIASFTNMFTMSEFQFGDTTIRTYRGDITRPQQGSHPGDTAIVNAANESLLGGSGIDGAIHGEASDRLREYCRNEFPEKQGSRCPVGQACITPSFNLASQGINCIIHTVGPKGENPNRRQLLKRAYLNCLNLANSNNITSIAFPAISTGIYRYPPEEATQVAIDAVLEYFQTNKNSSIKEVHFILSEDRKLEMYNSILGQKRNHIPTAENTDNNRPNTENQQSHYVRNTCDLASHHKYITFLIATTVIVVCSILFLPRYIRNKIKNLLGFGDNEKQNTQPKSTPLKHSNRT